MRLLQQVRAAQRHALWRQGALLGLACALALIMAGGAVSSRSLGLGRALLFGALPAGLAVLLWHGLYLARRTVGSFDSTARLVAKALPELSFDLLAAVELSRAMGQRHDFSLEMARAFLRSVDERSATAHHRRVIDRTPTKRAWAGVLAVGLLSALALTVSPGRFQRGWALALHRAPPKATVREPITGDVKLTYRYPAYTGLAPRIIEGTTGEVLAPLGTEVVLETRADRDIEGAVLELNGERVPLKLSGRRELSGSFIVDKAGLYHFAFLDGEAIDVAGPDLPVRVEADQAPAVRLLAPVTELEIDPDAQQVALKYEVADDYGLSALELVYQSAGQAEVRVPLTHDDGRTTSGDYRWDLGALKLSPGQRVKYFIEAKDNDEVSGHKAGRSTTQTVKLYSAAEHRREALKKAEALWERLVEHLGERMESKDRLPEKTAADAQSSEPLDGAGTVLAADLVSASGELSKEPDAPVELAAGLANAGNQLQRDVGTTTVRRRLFLKLAADGKGKDMASALSTAASNEIRSTEKSVLYIEGLLDRVRLKDLKELAEQLRKDRRELAELLEKLKGSNDEQVKAEVLKEVAALRERMNELMERMGELAKSINDEFMNQEALRELQEENDMHSALDDIDKMVREGNVDEAMSKLQELAMQMDKMLENLDQAEQSADENADPELAKMFEDFEQGLQQLAKDQEQLSDKTKSMRDKYRDQMKEQIARRGDEVKEQVLKRAQELKRDYEHLDSDALGRGADKPKESALQDLSHLESALKANDYDLALEAAHQLAQSSGELQLRGDQQKRLDEMFGNPPDVRRQSKEMADRLGKDARKAEDIERSLENLFPQSGQMLHEGDKQQLSQQEAQQRALEQRAQQLMQQMDGIQQRAPVFDPESEQALEQAGQRMQSAAQRLQGKDPGKGFSEQQGALEALKGLQQQMNQQQQQGGKGKNGLPMPMRRRGQGKNLDRQKVVIPDEDPSRAPRELRKDVMDAMKQGAPDRYKDQVKRYYEELVK